MWSSSNSQSLRRILKGYPSKRCQGPMPILHPTVPPTRKNGQAISSYPRNNSLNSYIVMDLKIWHKIIPFWNEPPFVMCFAISFIQWWIFLPHLLSLWLILWLLWLLRYGTNDMEYLPSLDLRLNLRELVAYASLEAYLEHIWNATINLPCKMLV